MNFYNVLSRVKTKMSKTKKEKEPLTDGQHIIASFIEGLFILLIVLIVIYVVKYVFRLRI